MKNIYHSLLLAPALFGALFLQALMPQTLSAQAQPTLAQRPADKPAAKPATGSSAAATTLPTEDTVNSFLFQTFGYDPTITWKIADIRPSEIPGLAEVAITITTSQGSNTPFPGIFCPSVPSPTKRPARSWKRASVAPPRVRRMPQSHSSSSAICSVRIAKRLLLPL